ncbi:MAG: hypothetical protein U9N46_01620, partial [Euryarchaeota archaeon]|nr:hypothetical protein [Euryarchaeota archaeon]
TRRIQRATYLLSIEDGVTKRNKNGKVLGCGTHPNMESFHHPRRKQVAPVIIYICEPAAMTIASSTKNEVV